LVRIRSLYENEFSFFLDMLYESIYLSENKPPREDLLYSPHLKKYHEGWGRKGDRAFVAVDEENRPIGAAWYRVFSGEVKGYGYVNDQTPELGIAVTEHARGKGVGYLLMTKLFEQAMEDGYPSLSLSVDPANKAAVKLYKKLGFTKCGICGTSWTMVRHLSPQHS